MGFFENWDKSPQKKWDKGVPVITLDFSGTKIVYYLAIPSGSGLSTDCPNGEEEKVKS